MGCSANPSPSPDHGNQRAKTAALMEPVTAPGKKFSKKTVGFFVFLRISKQKTGKEAGI